MHSASPDPNDTAKLTCGGSLITGGFIAGFILFFHTILGPQQLMAQPVAIMFWCIGLALTIASLDFLGYLLQISFLMHGITFIISQWLGLWGGMWLTNQTIPPFLFNPLIVIQSNWQWSVPAVIIWGLIIYLNKVLARLSRIPQDPMVLDVFSETNLEHKLVLEQWKKDWRVWRVTLVLLIFISVLFFVVQFPMMQVTEGLRKLMIAIFFSEVGLGLILLIIGFFFYKRAGWKVDGMEVGDRLKTVWYQGLAIFFGGTALLGGILPADFGRPDEWWRRLLTLLSKSPIGGPQPRVVNRHSILRKSFLQYVKINDTLAVKLTLEIILIIALVIPILMALTFIIIMIGYFCTLLYPSFAKEIEHIKGLPKVFLKVYLLWVKFWRNWRSRIKFGGGNKRADLFTDDPGGLTPGVKNKAHAWGRGPQAIIRRGYYRMVDVARSCGFHWHPSQTSQDIAIGLHRLLPEDKTAITTITEEYQQARYGLNAPPAENARFFERLRRAVELKLKLLGRNKES